MLYEEHFIHGCVCVPASCAYVPASHMEATEVVTSIFDDRVGTVVLPTTKFTNPLLWSKTQSDNRQNCKNVAVLDNNICHLLVSRIFCARLIYFSSKSNGKPTELAMLWLVKYCRNTLIRGKFECSMRSQRAFSTTSKNRNAHCKRLPMKGLKEFKS